MNQFEKDINDLRVAVAEIKADLKNVNSELVENKQVITELSTQIKRVDALLNHFESMTTGIKIFFGIIMAGLALAGSVKALFGKAISFLY